MGTGYEADRSIRPVDFLLAIILGIFAGTFAGLLPGVGATVSVLILFPILLTFDPINIIVCFVSLYSMTQYVGSVPALLLGVPGEASSLPAVIEGQTLKQQNRIGDAIAYTAIGSLVGSVIVVALTLISGPLIENLAKIYRTPLQTVLIFLVLTMMFFYKENKKLTNLVLMIAGYVLGMIGIHGDLNREFLTFGNVNLYSGLPMFPVLLSLFVFPLFLKTVDTPTRNISPFKIRLSYFVTFFKHSASSLRGTLLGFIGGFCPGMTHAFSSQLAYTTEKAISKDSLKSVISSETANNAGAFSAVLPLIILGIPISSSEALLLAILETKSFAFSLNEFIPILQKSAVALLIVNVIGIIIAWPLAKHVCKIFLINQKKLYTFLFLSLVVLNYYIGSLYYSEYYYMIVLLCCMPVGYLLRKVNTMPLIFCFIIANYSIELMWIFYQLYLM